MYNGVNLTYSYTQGHAKYLQSARIVKFSLFLLKKIISMGKIIFFDTETTGTPRNYNAPVTDTYNWPRLVQLGWIISDESGYVIKQRNYIVKPNGFVIPQDASNIHGITTEYARNYGRDLNFVLCVFFYDLNNADRIVGHNIDFDQHIVGAELYRLGMSYDRIFSLPVTCTMKSSIDYCKLPPIRYGEYKWPKLEELYIKLFGRSFSGAHDAGADILATKECYFELNRRGVINDGLLKNFVRKVYDNGVYEGDFIDGKRTGKGKYTWSNGDVYEGDWVNDNLTGKGKLTQRYYLIGGVEGRKYYEGDFVDGKFNGKGKLTDESYDGMGRWTNMVYEGDFVDGEFNGRGKFTREWGNYAEDEVGEVNEEVNEGYFVNGKFIGNGEFTK